MGRPYCAWRRRGFRALWREGARPGGDAGGSPAVGGTRGGRAADAAKGQRSPAGPGASGGTSCRRERVAPALLVLGCASTWSHAFLVQAPGEVVRALQRDLDWGRRFPEFGDRDSSLAPDWCGNWACGEVGKVCVGVESVVQCLWEERKPLMKGLSEETLGV